MQHPFFLVVFAALLLAGCNKSSNEQQPQQAAQTQPKNQDPHDLKALADELSKDVFVEETNAQPIITADGKIQIDWTYIDTKEPRADLTHYDYPIALDSQAVKNYADAYHISAKQAQHSIVVAMAAPEALGKILDQLTGKYLGHHISDGDNITLTIYTTSDVLPQKRDYVFADSFGKGLVLPVIITVPKNPPKSTQKQI